MAKIPQELREAMENADDSGFAALEDGYYLCKLIGCDRSDAEGDSGFYFHTAKWSVIAPKMSSGAWLWDRLSESPRSAFAMRAFFDAMGYSYDSDTDEMVDAEERAILQVSQVIIQKGKRKGDWGNNVDGYLEPTEENLKLVAD